MTLETYEVYAAWLTQEVFDWAVQSHHSNVAGHPRPYLGVGFQFALYDYLNDQGVFDEMDDLVQAYNPAEQALESLAESDLAVDAIMDIYGRENILDVVARMYGAYSGEEERIHSLGNMVEISRASQFNAVFLSPMRASRRELELARELLEESFPTGLSVSDGMMAAIVNYWDHLIAVSR